MHPLFLELGLTQHDLDTIQSVLTELRSLCHYALEHKVRIMIDAEQTYFQRAIDDVALYLCRHVNPRYKEDKPMYDKALVFNTYQMYLKDALPRLERDITRAHQQGYSLGVKLVRGTRGMYLISRGIYEE
jgi:proline dehydrogenase